MRLLTVTSSVFFLVNCVSSTVAPAKQNECKCFPGDACWPSEREWITFNTTVGGRLIKTVPLGSPCHDPHYDAALCDALTSQWKLAPVHINSSSSVQAAIFANASCDPFTPRSSACLLGNYVSYSVNVTGPDDIAATIRFADKKNIRLVIRNTGHDYMGRSTGAGGLAIWTHYLKGIEVKDWSDPEYTGKAIKIGAGAQGFEILQTAGAAGLVVVTGECPTVGIAGGYTQSGGHSPLSTKFGLSADNTLEFEVVTADGRFIRASPFTPGYADLFWALSGSGSGNYGVVVSVTLRAHPDAVTSGASFSIVTPGLDFSAVLNAFHSALPQIIDSGTQVTYLATNSYTTIHSISGYNQTQADIENALEPFIKSMAAMSVALQPNYTQFESYHDHYLHYYGPLPAGAFGGAGDQLMGGRLLLRGAIPNLANTINETLQLGVQFIGQALNVSRFASPGRRAVMPQWRDAVVMSAYSMPYSTDVPFSAMEARQDYITDTVMPLIERVTPNAGAYINEADFQQENWQDVFYGSNYPKLLAVKKKYDPKGIFYNKIAVGSEGWVIREDGRMCRS
ncbi:6-hydroxy-D-nicotine oxidase [Melanomma pulvis-pyrius CBS 109.77]|uniref:6-hydroxy-D-nicotine oxidase n=1 Tax=Melanomma pulvis-pyrius CBS 109.77 TaxID=1314802 RepID=A0A6A6X3Z6_9PLEO|nr:6-hydroxy-D-nicotine oxidase [Melanomma pulvis-pyrius CBS 109.77]